MDDNLEDLCSEHCQRVERFFESMPSRFMKSGKIDLGCIRSHILHCLTGLLYYEKFGVNSSDASLIFYSALTEVARPFAVKNEKDSDASYPAHNIINRFFLETCVPLADVDKEIDEDTEDASGDWNLAYWTVTLKSVSSKDKLAALDKAAHEQSTSCKNRYPSRRKALLIHYAVASPSGSIEVAKAVASPAAVRCKDANGRVPLHWAAMHSNSVDMIDYLLEEWPGATKAQDEEGYTPLYRLIERDQFPEQASMIERLIDADPASCSIVTTEGENVLHLFCGCFVGDADMEAKLLAKLLDVYPNAVSQKSVAGALPLHTVCEYPFCGEEMDVEEGKANLKTIETLLSLHKEGASVMDDNGALPAHLTVNADCIEALQLLLDAYPEALSREANVRVNIVSQAALCSEPALKYLLQRSPELASVPNTCGKLPLHETVVSGNVAPIEPVYAAYPEAIRMFTNMGQLPLHFALRYGVVNPLSEGADIVRLLLRLCPETANMRRVPEGEAPAGDADWNRARKRIFNEGVPMRFTPYQISRYKSCGYIQRILLRACPAADPQRLLEMNYQARRQLMFLAFAARTSASSNNTSSKGHIHQLRRLMNIGEEMGLLKHIASYL